MRQVWIPRYGAPEVLEVRESPDPTCARDQVRVRVKFAGINFADLMARAGLYRDAPKPPLVVGYEVSGVIDQVGGDVSGLKVGDRVCAMPKFGGYTDVLCVPAPQAMKIPAAMSFEHAAALPVVYLTAHHLLLFTGTLRRGMRILVHSAAGGVGVAAIQLARAYECEIFGTASPGKHDFLRELGVKHPIDSTRDVFTAVREILEREGTALDLVLDPIGGRSWREGYKLLGPTGRLVCFGISSASEGTTRGLASLGAFASIAAQWWNPGMLMTDNKSITGCNMGALFERIDLLRPQFDALFAMYERGAIRPHVDRAFSFAEAGAAHQWLHDRKARGKVLLHP